MSSNPHDVLVKKTFSNIENAKGELRAVLPDAISARIDWSTLALEPGSFVDADAREWHTDLLFSAQLAAHRVLIYLLFEHQSTVDRWMPKRVLTYVDEIWTRERDKGVQRLPVVLPIILHHSESGWTAGRHLHDLLDADAGLLALVAPYVPAFEILVDDLGLIPEVELLEREMTPTGRIVLWALRAQRVGHDPELIALWAPELERARASGQEALKVFFVYLSEVDGGTRLLNAILDADVTENVREVAMGLRKELEDEAEARWRLKEARVEALAEARGRAETLLLQLRMRFGELPEPLRERVQSASVQELERWAKRILFVDRLEDLFA